MLRNLVSSLLEHQSISTTLPKAKEAQKLAEKVIQWGKNGTAADWARANSYLLVSLESAFSSAVPFADLWSSAQNPTKTLRPLFTTFSQRYAQRSGGYTRLHHAGSRVGDNAPLAILELVDGPNDLKFEGAAKTVGREMAIRAREGAGPEGWKSWRARVEQDGAEGVLAAIEESVELDALTRKNVTKALAIRSAAFTAFAPPPSTDASGEEVIESSESLHPATLFLNRTYHHYLRSLAQFSLSITPTADPERTVKQLTQRLTPSDARGPPRPVLTVPRAGRAPRAGERTDGWASELDVEGEKSKRGGPISLAKGPRAREVRRSRKVGGGWTGTKRSDEALAGEV